ncbi:glycoside hydrolase family 30 protein [Vibrio ulleungensis]|uniref:Glycoside hydrolase family 30 protein n=1 Tax=Vibrio ulleungensis TaxID=2807619 RepID=A0ABS2HL32_9VIBR|nr:glycoside hydrolase family 30 protein [Vibrio ulleungensis]MBM7037401.1 glycoside hydrolase family 30 protein [Vibrio ulleungensis]
MKAKLVRTKKASKEFWTPQPDVIFKDLNEVEFKPQNLIAVDSSQEFQEHMGFGGSFTEAAAVTLSEAPEAIRQEALTAYFSKSEGLGYNLGRLSIHSCDFGLGNYTYIEEGDAALDTFDMSHDDELIIPMIKEAQEIAGEDLTLLASPWSPPAFMKDNNEMNYGGKLLPEYHQAWANYFSKFIHGMQDRGINLWGVSVQNEPAATQTWDSCQYSADEEKNFVRDYLGPTLEINNQADKNIVIWDHNRDLILERAIPAYSDPEAAKYIWGVGNHWYVSEDFELLGKLHDLFPEKHILFTEGCVEYGIYGNEPVWENGEHYGRNIIGDFNNWSRGWIDWNLFLNEEGGPNHVSNFCEAPIMYDRKKQQLIYNISYYYIGHFSKYIQTGAKRILTTTTAKPVEVSGTGTRTNAKAVSAVAYKNPNGEIVIVAQNEGHIAEMTLMVDGKAVNISLPNNSISTFII